MKKIFLLLSAFLIIAITGFSQKSPIFLQDGTAIRGHDAVAYFTNSKAVKGSKGFSFKWNDAVWYFVSAENLEVFKKEPEKYAPQYGGYCAYGTSEGHKAPTEPEAWTIIDNKLYLNYNKNVQGMWKKDTEANIQKANKQWPLIKDKE